MNNKWIRIAAGILILIGSLIQIGLAIYLHAEYNKAPAYGPNVLALALATPLTFFGTVSLISEYSILLRKHWIVAFIGSICSYLPFTYSFVMELFSKSSHSLPLYVYLLAVLTLLLHVATVALTVLSRKQFR